jgi:hypothetical protein
MDSRKLQSLRNLGNECEEAADEIDRLTRELAEAARAPLAEENARLKEQIERMDTVMEGMRSFWNEDHEGLEKARARIAELENQLGITRMCVMCGKYKPAAEPRESPGCPPVDPEYGHLCGFDMTPQEAWAHWRQRAHDRRIESDRLRAEVEALTAANAALVASNDALRADAERYAHLKSIAKVGITKRQEFVITLDLVPCPGHIGMLDLALDAARKVEGSQP